MRTSLLHVLRMPRTGERVTVYSFESNKLSPQHEEDIVEGILLSDTSKTAYPILRGVPVMLDCSFPERFLKKHEAKISHDPTLAQLAFRVQPKHEHWSFSSEWDEHFDSDLNRTWAWTVEERTRQFLLETDVDAHWCAGKLILDAGCGNGQLSESLTQLGASVVGLDYSTSVFGAEKRRRSPNVHFIQGDLQTPPFEEGTFDLVISNGVLHHTPDTYKTFIEVAKLVKPEGRLYVWLYRKSEKALRRYFFTSLLESTRTVVSRIPKRPQAHVVKAYAAALLMLHKTLGKHGDLSWPERVVSAYDNLTPRWRHYHTPLEVSCWFFLNGYSSPRITHWDNPYGFGLVASKRGSIDTPGVNFGKSEIGKRFWD